jgi:hypothetical protein
VSVDACLAAESGLPTQTGQKTTQQKRMFTIAGTTIYFLLSQLNSLDNETHKD